MNSTEISQNLALSTIATYVEDNSIASIFKLITAFYIYTKYYDSVALLVLYFKQNPADNLTEQIKHLLRDLKLISKVRIVVGKQETLRILEGTDLYIQITDNSLNSIIGNIGNPKISILRIKDNSGEVPIDLIAEAINYIFNNGNHYIELNA